MGTSKNVKIQNGFSINGFFHFYHSYQKANRQIVATYSWLTYFNATLFTSFGIEWSNG